MLQMKSHRSRSSGLRFTGLVAAMNRVREQWQHGIPAGEQPAFRQRINATIEQVERICRDCHRTPRQLPPQSYRAYRYLKSLDLNAIPVRAADTPAPSGPLRVRNLVAFAERANADLLALARSADPLHPAVPAIAALRTCIAAQAAEIAAIAHARHTTPAALPTPSRRIYQWLTYLAHEANLLRVLGTLREAAHIIETLSWLREVNVDPARLSFALQASNYIYRTRSTGGELHILAAPGFAGAPRDVLEAVIRAALSRRQRKARLLVKAYASDEAFAEESLRVELAAGLPQAIVRGRTYDLSAVFAQVNAEYFGGRLSPPRLTWSKTVTWHTLGHYHAESDTVMISIALDSPSVPAYAIAFVMYHELLHRELGVPLVNGRRQIHNRAFREAERRFKDYAAAEAALKQHAR
jgi:hypothetical protein